MENRRREKKKIYILKQILRTGFINRFRTMRL